MRAQVTEVSIRSTSIHVLPWAPSMSSTNLARMPCLPRLITHTALGTRILLIEDEERDVSHREGTSPARDIRGGGKSPDDSDVTVFHIPFNI